MLVDAAMLEMLAELRIPGQPDPVTEILAVFEADGRRVLGMLRVAAQGQDARGVHEAAHRMKGASANLGAIALQQRLLVLEQATRDGGLPDGLDDEVTEVADLFSRTLVELDRLARAQSR
ncbi:MAG: Hpt domain-containing protein [Alphaproteobacteria bacterium]|nr:Hpt domain-containing protein [Alphaproteobacteria bacterium]MCB9672792.1 Hpt domain-containing protein [Alphaproteobacteria bacterium]MCB9694720.1 Hpt domain-containing protein [Alphaproteobacteria bacterium]